MTAPQFCPSIITRHFRHKDLKPTDLNILYNNLLSLSSYIPPSISCLPSGRCSNSNLGSGRPIPVSQEPRFIGATRIPLESDHLTSDSSPPFFTTTKSHYLKLTMGQQKYDAPNDPPPGYPSYPQQAAQGSAQDFYGGQGDPRGQQGYYGSPPPQQQYGGYPQQGGYQQGPYGPPQGQQPMYYQQQGPYPPQGGYQGQKNSGGGGICAGILGALACCCCLDAIF